jgi:hypothetical protein
MPARAAFRARRLTIASAPHSILPLDDSAVITPEFARIMKDLGQPVNYMGGDEYGAWLKNASTKYATLLKTLNIVAEAK